MNRKGNMNDSKPNQGLGWVAVTSTSFSRSVSTSSVVS